MTVDCIEVRTMKLLADAVESFAALARIYDRNLKDASAYGPNDCLRMEGKARAFEYCAKQIAAIVDDHKSMRKEIAA